MLRDLNAWCKHEKQGIRFQLITSASLVFFFWVADRLFFSVKASLSICASYLTSCSCGMGTRKRMSRHRAYTCCASTCSVKMQHPKRVTSQHQGAIPCSVPIDASDIFMALRRCRRPTTLYGVSPFHRSCVLSCILQSSLERLVWTILCESTGRLHYSS